MGDRFTELKPKHQAFIERQQMFFVATAAPDGRVNVSPKGLDSLRVLGPNKIVWLNITGSGNETAAHVQENSRMTLMFCAFEGSPLILRAYGHARIIDPDHDAWDSATALFPPTLGTRQLFEMEVDLVQTSCGFGVPLYEFAGQRDLIPKWAERKGEAGVKAYQQEYNRISLDGKLIH